MHRKYHIQQQVSPYSQASISHNSLSSECLYVNTVTSQWKIGGFEAASLHKKMDAKVSSQDWRHCAFEFDCIMWMDDKYGN